MLADASIAVWMLLYVVVCAVCTALALGGHPAGMTTPSPSDRAPAGPPGRQVSLCKSKVTEAGVAGSLRTDGARALWITEYLDEIDYAQSGGTWRGP